MTENAVRLIALGLALGLVLGAVCLVIGVIGDKHRRT